MPMPTKARSAARTSASITLPLIGMVPTQLEVERGTMTDWEPWRHRLSAAAAQSSPEKERSVRVPCGNAEMVSLTGFVASLRLGVRHVVSQDGPEHAKVAFGGKADLLVFD